MSPLRKLYCRFQTQLRYVATGLVTTGLNALVTLTLVACQLALPLASAIAFVLCGQVSFQMHSRWTFHARRDRRLIRRWALCTLGGLLFGTVNRFAAAQSLQLFSFLESDFQTKAIAYVVAFAISWPGNLAWCNLVVFSHIEEDHREESA